MSYSILFERAVTDALSHIKEAINGFQALPQKEWQALEKGLIVRFFSKGHLLLKEGQIANHIYFLHRGATRHYFIRDGKEFTVDFHFAGDFVTAYYSLITREPGEVFIEVLEDTEAVALPLETLNTFYRRYPGGERIGRLMAETQYTRRLRREMDLLSKTAEQRFAMLMQRNPELVQHISVKHLSSYLGIQPESLSRIRKQYARNLT